MKKTISSQYFDLVKFPIQDLVYLSAAPFDFFHQSNLSNPTLRAGTKINRATIESLTKSGYFTLLFDRLNAENLQQSYKKEIIEICKKFSHGNPTTNIIKTCCLLISHQKIVYKNPFDRNVVQQHWSLLKLMSEIFNVNQLHLPKVYKTLSSLKFHYLEIQPLLSTIIYFGLLNHSKVFDQKFNQELFIASLLKDLGMGLIPSEILSSKKLTEKQKNKINQHALYSHTICQQNLHLSTTQLNLIKHHHDIKSEKILFGPELTFIHFSDALSALTSNRPHRPKNSLYKALEVIKISNTNSYAAEFKLLVNFSSKFFNI